MTIRMASPRGPPEQVQRQQEGSERKRKWLCLFHFVAEPSPARPTEQLHGELFDFSKTESFWIKKKENIF